MRMNKTVALIQNVKKGASIDQLIPLSPGMDLAHNSALLDDIVNEVLQPRLNTLDSETQTTVKQAFRDTILRYEEAGIHLAAVSSKEITDIKDRTTSICIQSARKRVQYTLGTSSQDIGIHPSNELKMNAFVLTVTLENKSQKTQHFAIMRRATNHEGIDQESDPTLLRLLALNHIVRIQQLEPESIKEVKHDPDVGFIEATVNPPNYLKARPGAFLISEAGIFEGPQGQLMCTNGGTHPQITTVHFDPQQLTRLTHLTAEITALPTTPHELEGLHRALRFLEIQYPNPTDIAEACLGLATKDPKFTATRALISKVIKAGKDDQFWTQLNVAKHLFLPQFFNVNEAAETLTRALTKNPQHIPIGLVAKLCQHPEYLEPIFLKLSQNGLWTIPITTTRHSVELGLGLSEKGPIEISDTLLLDMIKLAIKHNHGPSLDWILTTYSEQILQNLQPSLVEILCNPDSPFPLYKSITKTLAEQENSTKLLAEALTRLTTLPASSNPIPENQLRCILVLLSALPKEFWADIAGPAAPIIKQLNLSTLEVKLLTHATQLDMDELRQLLYTLRTPSKLETANVSPVMLGIVMGCSQTELVMLSKSEDFQRLKQRPYSLSPTELASDFPTSPNWPVDRAIPTQAFFYTIKTMLLPFTDHLHGSQRKFSPEERESLFKNLAKSGVPQPLTQAPDSGMILMNNFMEWIAETSNGKEVLVDLLARGDKRFIEFLERYLDRRETPVDKIGIGRISLTDAASRLQSSQHVVSYLKVLELLDKLQRLSRPRYTL